MAEQNNPTEFHSASVYRDTMYFVNEMTKEFPLYPEIMHALRDGKGSVEMRKRIMLRAIDEVWVTAIEDSLAALDTVTRKPTRFITEEEQVLPIELTRSVSSRSVKHLAQHTDFISKIDGDEITPSKLLNVFQEETMETYENKFINTLLSRLYAFVHTRYMAAKESGQDTRNLSVEFKNDFRHGSMRGKLLFRMEIEEPARAEDVEKNYVLVSDLWKRVEKLNLVCSDYMQSTFVQNMGKSYIRPPVMRTNAILKNREMRQCLALWEFIEGYENAGYSTMIEDSLFDMDESYIRELYSTMAMQYLLFRTHVDKGFDEDAELAKASTELPLTPEIISDLTPATVSEFAIHVANIEKATREQTVEEREVLRALEVALLASEVVRRRTELEELQDKHDTSFEAKLILAGEPALSFYSEIKNALLSYEGMRSRITWKHESFTAGRTTCARVVVKGKTLVLYLPLDPKDESFRTYSVLDMSGSTAYKNVPLGIKIRSRKALTNALKLIAAAMENLRLDELPGSVAVDYRFAPETREQLIARGAIRVRRFAAPEDTTEQTPEPIPEEIEEPIPEPIPEVPEEPIPEPIPEVPEEPIPEPIPEKIEEPIPEPIPEEIEEPIPEPIPEEIEEPIPEPTPESTDKKQRKGLFGRLFNGSKRGQNGKDNA